MRKRNKNMKTHEQFTKEVMDKFGDVYNILEAYKGADTKIQVQHKCPDGDYYTWGITPSNLLNGKGLCPRCSGKSKGLEEFKRKVLKKYGDEYIVIGEYKGTNNYVAIKHNTKDCQFEFSVRADHFLAKDTTCTRCSSMSKGEDKIDDNCVADSIPFIRQYTFDDCVYKVMLRFDFAIFEDKDKTDLKYLIEYQGIHHYKPQRFNGISQEKAEQNFVEQKIKDKIKVDYCHEHNIELLIIPYWRFDYIEQILDVWNE